MHSCYDKISATHHNSDFVILSNVTPGKEQFNQAVADSGIKGGRGVESRFHHTEPQLFKRLARSKPCDTHDIGFESTNDCTHVQVCGCHAGCQEVSRCYTRGESEESIAGNEAHKPGQTSLDVLKGLSMVQQKF